MSTVRTLSFSEVQLLSALQIHSVLPLENPEKAIPRVVLKLTKELGIATKSWMHSFHNFSRNILRKFYTNTTWSILWVTQKKKYSDLAFLPAKIDFFRDPWNCNSDKVRLKFVDIPSEKRHVFFFQNCWHICFNFAKWRNNFLFTGFFHSCGSHFIVTTPSFKTIEKRIMFSV